MKPTVQNARDALIRELRKSLTYSGSCNLDPEKFTNAIEALIQAKITFGSVDDHCVASSTEPEWYLTNQEIKKGVGPAIKGVINQGTPATKEVGLFVVRFYDGFDNEWTDITKPITKEEAEKVLMQKTENGTIRTSFKDVDYYQVFPANTKMYFSSDKGKGVLYDEPNDEETKIFKKPKTKQPDESNLVPKKQKRYKVYDPFRPGKADVKYFNDIDDALGAAKTMLESGRVVKMREEEA